MKNHPFLRVHFETLIGANKKTLPELEALRAKGELKDDDYVFMLEDVIKISVGVATGFWNNSAAQKTPGNKWSTETRAKAVREYIKEAFVLKANSTAQDEIEPDKNNTDKTATK